MEMIVDGIVFALFVVFIIAEVQQWGVPKHMKKLPLTYFEKE
jgi:hypothetical protein